MSLFFGIKATYDDEAIINLRLRSPLEPLLVPDNACEVGCVVAVKTTIQHILTRCRRADVRPSVIAWIAVPVVHLLRRPITDHVEEGEAGSAISASIYADDAIAMNVGTSCHGAWNDLAAGLYVPRPDPGLGIIVQDFAQTFYSQLSHLGRSFARLVRAGAVLHHPPARRGA